MLTRDIDSATVCINCKRLIDYSWHDRSEVLCPRCLDVDGSELKDYTKDES